VRFAALVLLLATTPAAMADDCRTAVRGYFSATGAVAEAMKLVDVGTKGWKDIKADDANRTAYDAANTALGTYANAVDAYATAVKAAEPHVNTCNASGDLPAADLATLTAASESALGVLDSGQAYLKAYAVVAPAAPAPAAPAPATK
jgi:hypothetical protein